MSLFFRLLGEEEKGAALAEAVRSVVVGEPDARVFEVAPESFEKVPGAPFSYWVSERIRLLFGSHPPFEHFGRIVRQGGVTGDDTRYLRLYWEVRAQRSHSGLRWVPFAKGGAISPWYTDYTVVVGWDETRGTFFGYTGLLHRPSERPSSADHYFRAGLTWPLRAARFAPVPLPRDSIFSIRGYAILAEEKELLALGAIGNSAAFDYVFKLALGRFGFPEFVVGVLQKLPLPSIPEQLQLELSGAADRAWSAKRSIDTAQATSHAFVLPALLQTGGATLAERAAGWAARVAEAEAALARIQAEIDERCFDLYGFAAEDRAAALGAIGAGTLADDAGAEVAADGDGQAREGGVGSAREAEDEDAEGLISAAATPQLVAQLLDWLAGVAFGRFDVRLATGERVPPPEPEPFDPLPVCSPGMLTGDAGLPLDRPPAGYPLPFPEDGVLVDDAGHPRDMAAAVRAGLEVALGAGAEEAWQEASALLGVEPRAWLARGLFEHHLRAHSKSRRRAPIYWQLATPSASYSVWLYAHRLGPDTFFRVLGDFVSPKVQHEERRLTALVQSAGPSPTASQRQEVAEQDAFVAELRAFRDEVARIAPLWRPDLDDGVIVNFAPLWRLVPQHRAWQRECRECWEKLVAGDYDWAHLAMHLWPERVVAKCAQDRSLAIAHGLEGVFWAEAPDGRWVARAVDAATVERLVGARASAAVKDALASLLGAPAPVSSRGLGRRTSPRAARPAPRSRAEAPAGGRGPQSGEGR